MNVSRCDYIVAIDKPKTNGQALTKEDIFNVGYMAGRFGVNLDNKPCENCQPKFTQEGTLININCCTKDLFEKNLTEAGISFDVMA